MGMKGIAYRDMKAELFGAGFAMTQESAEGEWPGYSYWENRDAAADVTMDDEMKIAWDVDERDGPIAKVWPGCLLEDLGDEGIRIVALAVADQDVYDERAIYRSGAEDRDASAQVSSIAGIYAVFDEIVGQGGRLESLGWTLV